MRLLVLLLLVASSLAAVDLDFCRGRLNANFPDPDFPCSSLFIRCWEGETIPKRCLVPGHRFDIRFRKCQPKDVVDACKPITPVPAPRSTPPPEFTCKGRRNGNYKIPGSVCTAKFFRCWEGQRFEVSCRIASFRILGEDGSLARCVPISKVPDCLPPPPPPTQPAPPSTETPFTCKGRRNGDYKLPDSGCTNKFITCWEGQLFERSCIPPAWRFDGEDGQLGKCRPEALVSICTPLAPPEPSFTCKGLRNGNYKLPESGCTNKFARCWEGELFERTCKPETWRFEGEDGQLGRCLPASKVSECKPPAPPTEPPFSCKGRRNGNYPKPSAEPCTNEFIRCWEGELIESICRPSTWRFSTELSRCLPAKVVSECSPPVAPAPSTEPPFSCKGRRNGNFPKPGAEPCTNEFIRCWEGELIDSICRPSTWRFSSELSRCLPEKLVSECTPLVPEPPVLPPKKPFFVEKDVFDCSELKDGGYADPKEPCSTSFFMCSSGDASIQDCAGKAFFDEISQSCLAKQYVKACGGTPTQKAESITKPPIKLPSIDFDCVSVPDGYYGNPQEECSSFFIGCSGGEKSVMACAAEMKFDSISERCIEKEFNKWCGGTPTTTTEAPPRRPPITEFNCVDKPDGFYAKGSAFGSFSKFESFELESFHLSKSVCESVYFGCSGGVTELMQCAAGLKFDDISQSCLEPQFVKACGGTPTPKPQTTIGPLPDPSVLPDASCDGKTDGNYADEWRPCEHHYYFSCRNGDLMIQECAQKNLRYDETIDECQEEEFIKKCGGTPTPKPTVKPVRVPDIDCSNQPEGAFFPNPKQPCSKDYYTCVGGIPQELWCPARLHYDVETNMCLHKLYIQACGGTPTPRPTTPLPAPPSTFVPPKKMVFDCFGRESGLFEDPENPCSPVYYKCFRGLSKKLVCPSPVANRFDVLSGRCLPKDLVLWCKF